MTLVVGVKSIRKFITISMVYDVKQSLILIYRLRDLFFNSIKLTYSFINIIIAIEGSNQLFYSDYLGKAIGRFKIIFISIN